MVAGIHELVEFLQKRRVDRGASVDSKEDGHPGSRMDVVGDLMRAGLAELGADDEHCVGAVEQEEAPGSEGVRREWESGCCGEGFAEGPGVLSAT